MFFSKIHCNASRAGRIAQCCLLPFLFASVPSLAQVINNGDPNPQVVRISATEYRIGSIVADTAARKLDVPGRVLRRAPPLEYFATTPGGLKAYETLLELDASAFEFNLACILIGLEPAEEGLPQFQFDRH